MDLYNKEERAPLVSYQSKTYYRILKAEGVESFIRKKQQNNNSDLWISRGWSFLVVLLFSMSLNELN